MLSQNYIPTQLYGDNMVTLKHIAEKAGVSQSTVSRVINGDSSMSVSKETEERIWHSVNETGYKFNIGTNSSTNKLNIGYILTITKEKFEDTFFSTVIYGIEQGLIVNRCNLFFTYTIRDLEDPKVLNNVLNSECDGLIIIGSQNIDIYNLLIERIPCCISLFDVPNENSIDCVTTDYEKYSYKMIKKIIDMGHREIAFIGGKGYYMTPEDYCSNSSFYDHEARLRGYIKALNDSNIPVNNKILKDGDWDIETAYNKMTDILDSGEKVTAVFAAGDKMAIGVMRAILDKNLNVPGDISVAGFDDIPISAYLTPPLTTVSYPKEEIGRAAVRVLLENIKSGKKNTEFPRKIMFGCNIVERESLRSLNKKDT